MFFLSTGPLDFCECPALAWSIPPGRGGNPAPLHGRREAAVFLYLHHVCRERNPLQQLVTAPGPIVGGRGNPLAGESTAKPSLLLTGSLYRAPVSSILPTPPLWRSPVSFPSSVLFHLPQHSHLPLLHFFCLTPHCSAAFSAQNNFCSGNSSPSLSTLRQYFSLAFALGYVAEH